MVSPLASDLPLACGNQLFRFFKTSAGLNAHGRKKLLRGDWLISAKLVDFNHMAGSVARNTEPGSAGI